MKENPAGEIKALKQETIKKKLRIMQRIILVNLRIFFM